MRFQLLCAFVVLTLVAPLSAQKSDAADERAGSWFSGDRDVFLERTKALKDSDLASWEAAAGKAAISLQQGDLADLMPMFDPLWDDDDKLVSGSVAKYAKRLEQLPAGVIAEWQGLTDADVIYAAASLIAENELFPAEKFSEQQFQAFKARFK